VRFLFDQHINARALRQLRLEGFDVVHVAEVGLSKAEDAEIFAWAMGEERIIVTRNYRDFAPLVELHAREGVSFPGVLFYATSVPASDVGHHVRALRDWSKAADTHPVTNGLAWLR
jgi:predicted nuclease of predicted toxin-antitoxin system